MPHQQLPIFWRGLLLPASVSSQSKTCSHTRKIIHYIWLSCTVMWNYFGSNCCQHLVMNHITISCVEIQQWIHCKSISQDIPNSLQILDPGRLNYNLFDKGKNCVWYFVSPHCIIQKKKNFFFCFPSAFDESCTELQKDEASYFSFPIKTVISKDTAMCLEGGTCKTFQKSQHIFHHSASHLSLSKCQIQANTCPSQK
jgi:hypothetical protein